MRSSSHVLVFSNQFEEVLVSEFDWRGACFDAERRLIETGRVVMKLAEALSARPPWKGTPPEEIIRIFEEEVRRDVDAD